MDGPVTVTVVVELLLRDPGTRIEPKSIATALRRTGLDHHADIVDVRLILGTLSELVQANQPATTGYSAPDHINTALDGAEWPSLRAAEGGK